MRIIDRYICREVFSHALLGLLIFTFVIFVPQLATLMALLVRHAGSGNRLWLLFLCIFPYVLTFTLPMAVLVGVLIGLGRLSADSELIALSALGIGMRRVLVPVGMLAASASLVTLTITLWVGPAAQRTYHQIRDELTASQASFEIQPRVFNELQHMVLYVEDATTAATHWHGVFLAQTSDKDTELTLAEDAIVVADHDRGKLELHMKNGSTHVFSPGDPGHYSVETFGQADWPVDINSMLAGRTSPITNPEKSLGELMASTGPNARDARVEVQRRFAFPAACMVFALLAVPLAARPRRGGRAMGFLVSLVLVCVYYLLFVIGVGLAREGKVPPIIGVWAANILTGAVGLALLPGMEQIRSATWLTRLAESIAAKFRQLYDSIFNRNHGKDQPGRLKAVPKAPFHSTANRGAADSEESPEGKGRVVRLRPVQPARMRTKHSSGFPRLLDLYILRNFLGYLLLVMVGFIFLFEIFTFFELLDDIARRHTPFIVVLNYFRFLVPFLFYRLAPFAVLIAAMITLGVMSKNNEIVAIKASGVSLYRLAWPLIGAGALLGLGLLALDNTYLPYFNQRQDALRAEIKGKAPQTYLRPNRSWIYGQNDKIFNYQLFDPDSNLFGGLNVFELDSKTFQLRRLIYASRAKWAPEQNAWLLEGGWVRDFDAGHVTHYTPFQVDTVAELTEMPEYFKRYVRQSDQMSGRELAAYINEIHQAGFDVGRLTVQLHEKLAFPMIAPIIAFLAIPFAFYVGTRGAIGGLALGMGIGITYWAASALFEALGGVGQLPPLMAAWAPDVIFIFLGTYFFLKMPT